MASLWKLTNTWGVLGFASLQKLTNIWLYLDCLSTEMNQRMGCTWGACLQKLTNTWWVLGLDPPLQCLDGPHDTPHHAWTGARHPIPCLDIMTRHPIPCEERLIRHPAQHTIPMPPALVLARVPRSSCAQCLSTSMPPCSHPAMLKARVHQTSGIEKNGLCCQSCKAMRLYYVSHESTTIYDVRPRLRHVSSAAFNINPTGGRPTGAANPPVGESLGFFKKQIPQQNLKSRPACRKGHFPIF